MVNGEIKMDKFNKYALITVTVIVAVLLVCAYVSYQVGGNSATDDNVNSKASGGAATVYYNPFTIEHWGVHGEYVGFFAAGCCGGFGVGYMYPTVFKTTPRSRRKNQ
jgi:hypothetical protein